MPRAVSCPTKKKNNGTCEEGLIPGPGQEYTKGSWNVLFYQDARKLSKTTGELSKGLPLTKDGTIWTSKRTISVKNKQTKKTQF